MKIGVLLCALLLVVSGALWWAGRSDGRLHLLIPALPGDGVLVKAGGGEIALIDGGADGAALANWLGHTMGLGRRRIDLLLQTRADATTLPGQLAAARRYDVGRAVLVRPLTPEPLWDELVLVLEERDVPIHFARAGDRLSLGTTANGGAMLEVLTVARGRATLSLTAGSTRALLLQSLGDEQLPDAARRGPVAALLYPWRRPTRDPALDGLRPAVIVFGEQPGDGPQLTLAERRVGTATLLHEASTGRSTSSSTPAACG